MNKAEFASAHADCMPVMPAISVAKLLVLHSYRHCLLTLSVWDKPGISRLADFKFTSALSYISEGENQMKSLLNFLKKSTRMLSDFFGGIIIYFVRMYQKCISPKKPPCCKYYPTCSQYAVIAVKKYGPLKGGLKSAYRILRCNPFSKGGVDEP